MKIILPLAALGLLSTLFLISRNFDPTKSVPVAQIDLERRAHEQGATNPVFAGVTSSGDQVMFRAKSAQPDQSDPAHLKAKVVTAQMKLIAGTVIDITSESADMNQERGTADLEGNVHITTTTGYVVDTDYLKTRIDLLYAETPGPVSGNGPPGDLAAGRMVLKTDEISGEPQLLFTDGVKLLYKPGKSKE
ncbi:LPS export ABC transporter periplasmic protein LptC [Roseovarius litorisediminis]|nr:LPS export ABC transporter periplasmic protein LptC [Roseovarius litorisediminis]